VNVRNRCAKRLPFILDFTTEGHADSATSSWKHLARHS
jgi:hypothetical protein